MRRLLLFYIFISVSYFGRAGEIKYPVSAIPEKLLKKAHVVKRMEEMQFEIISTTETILHHKYALTILDENGDDNAVLVEYYDKLQQIRSIEGALYDAAGNLVKKLKSKEVQDVSAVDDNNLIDDNRRKVHQFYYKAYPYTVEYEVETRFNNTLFIPAWIPQEDEHFSVEKSSYTIICPADYSIRYRAFNYQGEPVITTESNKKKMQWQVSALSPVTKPFASPSWKELTTSVFFGPTEFEIQGYKGNMSSWQEFGKFVYALKKDKDQLPDNIRQKVQQLVSGVTDDKEKIRLLYEYLQHQTRYISIQLGLGGWQPFDAAEVAKKGYGDCKALTNFMYTLLKAAGIRSCYTLVKAGPGQKILEDFPSQQFNHVILCVPLQKDTVWLECTSQSLPAGYMSEFTGNRKALLIDELGGTLVQTPRYGLRENLQTRTIQAKLDGGGTLQLHTETRYGGIQQDNLHMMINALSKDKVQKILQQELELSTYNVNDFKYAESKTVLPEINEQMEITVSDYATVTGKRLFIVPNILNRSSRRIAEDEQRTADFVFDLEYKDEDNTEIEIPEGYKIESAPQEMALKTKFGTYFCSVKLEGNKIIYHRIREQFSGRFPAKDQTDLAKFYEDIYKADRGRVVLVKSN